MKVQAISYNGDNDDHTLKKLLEKGYAEMEAFVCHFEGYFAVYNARDDKNEASKNTGHSFN